MALSIDKDDKIILARFNTFDFWFGSIQERVWPSQAKIQDKMVLHEGGS